MTLRMWAIAIGLVVASLFALDAVNAAPVKSAQTKKSAKVSQKAKKPAKGVGSKVAKKKIVPAKASGDLQTDVKFDDSVLHGQYQTPEEALARVENEKGLSDLLGVRKHFKDRLATASEQE